MNMKPHLKKSQYSKRFTERVLDRM